MSKPTQPAGQPSARGYRIREFCEREGIDRVTAWRWAKKGAIEVSRVAPATGVRVRYRDEDPQKS